MTTPATLAATPRAAPDFETWMQVLRTRRTGPAMTLEGALQSLGKLSAAQADELRREDPKLLGLRCRELVRRGLVAPSDLSAALARMSGLPDVAAIDPRQAPPEFLRLLLEPLPATRVRPEPARNMAQLVQAFEDLQHSPLWDLRAVLEDMRLLTPRSMDRLAAQNARIFGTDRALLVRRGVLTRDELGRALARVAAIPEVDAARFELGPGVFDVLPARTARARQVLPLGAHDDVFFVATGAPHDEEQRHALCETTGHTVLLVWGDSNAIVARVEAAERADDPFAPGEALEWTMVAAPETRIEAVDDEPADVQQLVTQAENEVNAVVDHVPASAVGEQSGMARLVKRIVLDAHAAGASDIHVENHPRDGGVLVRTRVDGELRPYLTLPLKLRPALVSRIKVMARLDIAQRRLPQDGKIDFSEYGGERLELRVAILPTHDGQENVVLRLLGTAPPLPLDGLGLQQRDRATIERLASRSFGLLLAAGPTGSGKTTTLHSMLKRLNTDERKIWTAEDPIEITQAGLNQVQVNPGIGLTFASAMRSFLRADPDVIMIGEIRDGETASVAIEASLTGHLVLSTLHTNNAAESVMRLLELGADPLHFADSLLGVVAQRLVRGLCRNCRGLEPAGEQGLETLLQDYAGTSEMPRAQALQRLMDSAGVDSPAALRVGVSRGCPACGGKGYRGRVGIFEILENSAAIRDLVTGHVSPSSLQAVAEAHGMRTLRHDALEKVVQGVIDLPQARTAYL